jgi:ABC-type microcin C transport system permease subunit YejB
MDTPERENKLGLTNEDLENMEGVLSDLIDIISKFKGFDDPTQEDYANLLHLLDYSKFIVSGVMYSNAIDVCIGHDDEDDDED